MDKPSIKIVIREPRSRHGGAPVVVNPKEVNEIPSDTYPPEWDVPNAYPPYWDFSNERMYNLYIRLSGSSGMKTLWIGRLLRNT